MLDVFGKGIHLSLGGVEIQLIFVEECMNKYGEFICIYIYLYRDVWPYIWMIQIVRYVYVCLQVYIGADEQDMPPNNGT